MGLGFLAAYGTAARLAPPPLLFLFFTLVAAVVFLWVAISAYDFRHMAIPDSWSYAAAALALGFAVLAGVGSPLLLALAGPLVALPLYLLWLVSGGRWLGAGDPKLALSVGWLLGASGGFLALFLAVLVGAAAGLAWVGLSAMRRRGKAVTMKAAMPFGPFIVLGAIVVLGTGLTFAHLFSGAEQLYGL